jgi:hypothetical protein
MAKTIESIEIKRVPDQDPDLSWLDQTDEQMGAGFEATATERKRTYGDTWEMVGVFARAKITINGVSQFVETGGLWGTESDSSDDHFQEIGNEELSQLKDMLIELGFPTDEIEARQHFAADQIPF